MEKERDLSMKKKSKNNKGLTLLELIVALAIVSVVVSLAFGFIIHTVRIYTRGSNDSLVQNDAQLTMSQLETLVVNANLGIGLDPDPAHAANKDHALYLYYRDYEETNYDASSDKEKKNVKPYEALHIYVDSTEGLCFNTSECTYGGTDASGNPQMNMTPEVDSKKQILSKYVSDFKVDVSDLVDKSELKVTLKFAHKDKNYETTNTIKLRNKIAGLNDKAAAGSYFQILNETDQKNQVIGISMDTDPPHNPPLDPSEVPTASSWAGTTFAVPFKVSYHYSDNSWGPGQTVWTVDDATKNKGVTINRMTGMITIPADYPDSSFDVYATALSAVNKVNTGDGSGKDEYNQDIINNKNRIKGVINVKTVSDPTLSAFTDGGDPKTMKATLTFPANHLDLADLSMIHPQVSIGSELRPVINNGTLGADGKITYDVVVHRPVNYKRPTPFDIAISCVVNGKTLTATGTVSFTPGADTLDSVLINVCDTQSTTDVRENDVLENRLRGDRAVLVMKAVYKDGGVTKYEDLTGQEWRLRCDDGSGVSVTQTSGGYSVSYNVADYSNLVRADMVFDYMDNEGNWDTDNHFTLEFKPVVLSSSVNSYSQSMFPITRGSTQKVSFTTTGLLNPTLYAYNRDNTKVKVSVRGFEASITAATNMSAAETVTFGLKKGSTVVDGVKNSIKFYPGAVNTRTVDGGNLTGKYALYIPPASDITRYDSSKVLTRSTPCYLYTADGKQIIYHDYSGDATNNKDVKGNTHQYWIEYEGKSFFYHAASRQWRLNEN